MVPEDPDTARERGWRVIIELSGNGAPLEVHQPRFMAPTAPDALNAVLAVAPVPDESYISRIEVQETDEEIYPSTLLPAPRRARP